MVDWAACLSICSVCEPGQPLPCCPSKRWNWPEFSAFRTFLLLLTAPSVAFIWFVCPYLVQHISPALLYVGIGGYLLSATMLLLTSLLDPGTMPKSMDAKRPGTRAALSGMARAREGLAC